MGRRSKGSNETIYFTERHGPGLGCTSKIISMKKTIFIVAICFICLNAFSQAEETFTEEKSSGWITVNLPERPAVRTSRPSRAAATPKTTTTQQPASEPKKEDAFEKTNKQVKRFKKGN
jgi:hypothetical protein